MISMADISEDQVIFMTPLERDKYVRNEFGATESRYYEEEAIRLFMSWRKRGGWLKDIRAVALQIEGHEVRQGTYRSLKSLGVEIVDVPKPKDHDIDGFLVEPWCGTICEKLIENDDSYHFLIKTDLDMVVLKPIPRELFLRFDDENVLAIVGQYDEKSVLTQRPKYHGNLPLDTNFIISRKNSWFYQKYFDTCLEARKRAAGDSMKEYFFDEIASDELYSQHPDQISTVQYYQYGDGYPPLSDYTDEEVRQMLFLHQHIRPNGKNGVDPKDMLRLVEVSR